MKKVYFSIIGTFLCAYAFYLYQIAGTELSLSPGLFPGILGIILIIIGADISFKSSDEETPLLLSALILGYGGLWYVLGAHLSTFSFAGLGLFILKEESLSRSLLFGLVLTVFIHILFVRFFGIQLN